MRIKTKTKVHII